MTSPPHGCTEQEAAQGITSLTEVGAARGFSLGQDDSGGRAPAYTRSHQALPLLRSFRPPLPHTTVPDAYGAGSFRSSVRGRQFSSVRTGIPYVF